MDNIKVITDKDSLSLQNIEEFKAMLHRCEYAYTDDLNEYIDFANGKCLIASFDYQNQMNGFATLEDEFDQLYISLVFVDSLFRHKGIASALLDKVKEYAKDRGFEKIYLIVNRKNNNAYNLYQKKDYISMKSNDNYLSCFMYKYVDDNLQTIGQFISECCEFDEQGFLTSVNKTKSLDFALKNGIDINSILKSKHLYSCMKILSILRKEDLTESVIYYFDHIATNTDYEDFCSKKLGELFPGLSNCNREDFKNAHIPLGAFYCYEQDKELGKIDFDKQSIESFFENKI